MNLKNWFKGAGAAAAMLFTVNSAQAVTLTEFFEKNDTDYQISYLQALVNTTIFDLEHKPEIQAVAKEMFAYDENGKSEGYDKLIALITSFAENPDKKKLDNIHIEQLFALLVQREIKSRETAQAEKDGNKTAALAVAVPAPAPQ